MIVIEPCAGLGNRFIALASAYHASQDLKKNLTVIWKNETALSARASSLFTLPNGIKVEQISEMGYKSNLLGQLMGNVVKQKYKIKAANFFECDQIMGIYQKTGQRGVRELIKARGEVYIKATNPFWDIDKVQDVFGFIKPKLEITEKRDALLKPAKKKKLIGVHIRRTDHQEAIKYSPDELFVVKMRDEIAADPDVCFYLATDDGIVEEAFKTIFGDKIITFDDKTRDRDSEQGIMDAYVEMLCLASCTKIYGSFNSTFSKVSSMMGNIPLIVVKQNVQE